MLTERWARSTAPAVFEAVATVSEPFDGVYLVGGTVRDILLGERNFDVDIAVEGDAIALPRRWRTRSGRVRAHEKFGTAVVIYGDDERVDVVTARTEFYDAPRAADGRACLDPRGPLPARLHDQRDGRLAQGRRLGRLVDPFGGRRDLEAETIRVLHNLSFIDDPTRIFRAIRYENRYGFRMDEHTLRLGARTIEMGLVGDLSSARCATS
jgi:tRNA nucleotidyltransferase (CCA-adding enzyme)